MQACHFFLKDTLRRQNIIELLERVYLTQKLSFIIKIHFIEKKYYVKNLFYFILFL